MENDPKKKEKESEIQKLLQLTQGMTEDEIQQVILYAGTLQTRHTCELL